MSSNIKKLSTFIDSRLVNLDLQGYKLVNLSGAKENKDTIIYTLERFLARDFGSYYNDIDKNLGVNYKSIEGSSTLQFISGISLCNDNKLTQRGTIPNIHCIRYVGKDRIRSFIINSNSTDEVVDANMTVFTSAISNSKWNRLATLVNKLVGFDFVKLSTKERKLSFNMRSNGSWSEEAIKFVYLLVSESMLTPENYTRVILLSDINILSNEQVMKLIETLNSISRNELIVFSNCLVNDNFKFSYKVLNFSV